jgi:hypothetical protein
MQLKLLEGHLFPVPTSRIRNVIVDSNQWEKVGPIAGAHKPTRRNSLVNAAILVISSALVTGGDVIPAGAWGDPPLPAMTQGCSNCGTTPSPCGCQKATLLDKLKAFCAPKPSCGCAPAPTCGSCGSTCSRPNLLDKIKEHGLCKKPACGCAPTPCATPGAPVVAPTAPTQSPPKDMPNLKDVPKTSDTPKTSTSSGSLSIPPIPPTPPLAPNPKPLGIPAAPTSPISSGSNSGSSPY